MGFVIFQEERLWRDVNININIVISWSGTSEMKNIITPEFSAQPFLKWKLFLDLYLVFYAEVSLTK